MESSLEGSVPVPVNQLSMYLRPATLRLAPSRPTASHFVPPRLAKSHPLVALLIYARGSRGAPCITVSPPADRVSPSYTILTGGPLCSHSQSYQSGRAGVARCGGAWQGRAGRALTYCSYHSAMYVLQRFSDRETQQG